VLSVVVSVFRKAAPDSVESVALQPTPRQLSRGVRHL
jgi:hypothetical protein